jgi:hypothetical protein
MSRDKVGEARSISFCNLGWRSLRKREYRSSLGRSESAGLTVQYTKCRNTTFEGYGPLKMASQWVDTICIMQPYLQNWTAKFGYMGLYRLGMKSTFHFQTIWGQVFDMTLYNIVARGYKYSCKWHVTYGTHTGMCKLCSEGAECA